MEKIKIQFYMDEDRVKIIDEFLEGTNFSRAQFFATLGNLQVDEIEAFMAPDPYEDDPNVDWSKTEKEVKDHTFFSSAVLQMVEFQKEKSRTIKGGK
jgi:hypothetical protein